MTVTDDGGAVTIISGSAVISGTAVIPDATMTAPPQTAINTREAATYPVPVFAPPVFRGVVATFTDSSPTAPVGEFTATIDWGDGTSPTAGIVTQPGGVGTAFDVAGSHTYADAGVNGGTGLFTIQVVITDSGGSRLTVTNLANVADIPIALTGILNPASDTGTSNSDDITNDVQPNFYGTSQEFSRVTLYETPVGGGATVQIGQTQAGGDGSWSITSNVLATGTYSITAGAVDQFGETTAGPVTIVSTLVIDPVPPVITNLTFDRFTDTLTVTYRDNLSGMDYASIANSAFYHMSATRVAKDVPVPILLLPASILITPGTTPTSPEIVRVVFNKGHAVRGGRYLIEIDSGTGDAGIQDIAGNALDGNFYGVFPSGDGIAGGDFVVAIDTFHNGITLPYVPARDGYVPPSAAVDPPAQTMPIKKTAKTIHSTPKEVSHPSNRAKLVDQALDSLHVGAEPKHRLR